MTQIKLLEGQTIIGGADTAFEETEAEHFPNLMTTLNPEIQEAQQTYKTTVIRQCIIVMRVDK